MKSLGVLLAVIAVFFATLPAVVRQWRNDREGFNKTLRLMGLYGLYLALGLGLLLLLAPMPGAKDDSHLLLTHPAANRHATSSVTTPIFLRNGLK